MREDHCGMQMFNPCADGLRNNPCVPSYLFIEHELKTTLGFQIVYLDKLYCMTEQKICKFLWTSDRVLTA